MGSCRLSPKLQMWRAEMLTAAGFAVCTARSLNESYRVSVWQIFPLPEWEVFGALLSAEGKAPSVLCTQPRGVFVVPVWRSMQWWRLVEQMQLVCEYPAGTQLFSAPGKDGQRVLTGPTRWPVVVLWDPAVRGTLPGEGDCTSVVRNLACRSRQCGRLLQE